MKSYIYQYWQQKSAKEKPFFIGILILIVGAISWLLVISPIKNFQEEMRVKQQKLEQVLLQINQLGPLAHLATKSHDIEGRLALNEAVSISANQAKINIKESELNEGVMRIRINEVSFDTLTLWLAELETQYHVRVEEIELQPIENKMGVVTVKQLHLSQRTLENAK